MYALCRDGLLKNNHSAFFFHFLETFIEQTDYFLKGGHPRMQYFLGGIEKNVNMWECVIFGVE